MNVGRAGLRTPRRAPAHRGPARAVPVFLLLFSACVRMPFENPPLTIATPWPVSERTRLERAFRDWLGQHHPGETPERIAWVVLAPGDDPVRLAAAPRHRLDLVLGGAAPVYVRLEQQGRLARGDNPGQPGWYVARRAHIGWALNRKADRDESTLDPTAPLGSLTQRDELAFDDPRRSPLTLAWAERVLSAGSWVEGYASLVNASAHAPRVTRQPDAALAGVERGEAVICPALPFATAESLAFVPGPKSATWIEGVAILQGGENPTMAARFLEFLKAQGQAEPPVASDLPQPDVDALVADLLGASLVDAQNELVSAWEAWERAGRPETFGRWLTEAPPWPPASVDRLLKTPGAGPLLDTLTAQITPEADLRAWLVRSWLVPERRVDGALLAELAGAMNGRLAREPRFRAWLRGEWTAWARQRYRRVERQLNLGRTPLAVGSP